MEISVLRLGDLGTNCYIFHEAGSPKCGVVDPGGQGERLAQWLRAVSYTHLTLPTIGG